MKRPLLFDLEALVKWSFGETPDAVFRAVGGDSVIYVSVLTLWEFILKQSTGRRSFALNYSQLLDTVRQLRAQLLPIKEAHLARLLSMPVVGKHFDPFDRLLIAQALAEDFVLVGGDRQFPAYAEALSLQVLWRL